MNIEALVNRAYASWAHAKGTSWTDHMCNALTEQAETHARELRAYEATVQNLEQRIREIEAQSVPVVGEGFVVVPVEPTPEMLKAGERGIGASSYVRKGMTIREYRFFKSGWDAMLAAAPALNEDTSHD